MNEELLLKNVDELKDSLNNVMNERDDFREQNEAYQIEMENVQKLLYEETESGSKASSKVALLTRQLDEEQKRSNEVLRQLDDARIQLKSVSMNHDSMKSELLQVRSQLQEHIVQVEKYSNIVSSEYLLLDF